MAIKKYSTFPKAPGLEATIRYSFLIGFLKGETKNFEQHHYFSISPLFYLSCLILLTRMEMDIFYLYCFLISFFVFSFPFSHFVPFFPFSPFISFSFPFSHFISSSFPFFPFISSSFSFFSFLFFCFFFVSTFPVFFSLVLDEL